MTYVDRTGYGPFMTIVMGAAATFII